MFLPCLQWYRVDEAGNSPLTAAPRLPLPDAAPTGGILILIVARVACPLTLIVAQQAVQQKRLGLSKKVSISGQKFTRQQYSERVRLEKPEPSERKKRGGMFGACFQARECRSSTALPAPGIAAPATESRTAIGILAWDEAAILSTVSRRRCRLRSIETPTQSVRAFHSKT
jgi:hypothetical protein